MQISGKSDTLRTVDFMTKLTEKINWIGHANMKRLQLYLFYDFVAEQPD